MKLSSRLPLFVLSFGNFVIGTGTFIVAGLLVQLADSLHTSIAAVGQLMTGFALAICLGAPVIASFTSNIDRRSLLIGAMTLFGLGHFLAALTSSYAVLMVLRIATGFGAAIFTPQAAVTAGLLVPTTERGRAISLAFLGFSIASLFGIPLGTYLGAQFGWRMTMTGVGVLAIGCAILLRMQLPLGLFSESINAAAWKSVRRNTVLLLVVATTAVQASAQFTLFTYIVPQFKDLLNATPTMTSLLLAWFGASGIVGNVVAGVFMDRIGSARIVTISIGLMFAGFLLWPLTRDSLPVMLLAGGLWGLGCFAINSAQQTRLVMLDTKVAPVSVSLNSSGIYLGQALGAMIGGFVIAHDIGLGALSWIGAAIFVMGLVVTSAAERKAPAS